MHSIASLASKGLLRSPCVGLAHRPFSRPLSTACLFPRALPRVPRPRRNIIELVRPYSQPSEKETPTLFLKGIGDKPIPRPPSFREALIQEDPSYGVEKYANAIGRPGVLRQVVFAILASAGVYVIAVEQTNIDTAKWSALMPNASIIPPKSEILRRAKLTVLAESLKRRLQKMRDSMSDLPNALTYPFLWGYVQLANAYINSSDGKRAALQIVAVNGVIWMMWQVSRLQPFMSKFFLHHPLSGRSASLLLSTFSHKSFLHFLLNSIALTSFGAAATSYLMRKQAENEQNLQESTPKYHLWALFVAAGVFSSLVSHVASTRILFPRMLAQLSSSSQSAAATSTASTAVSTIRRLATSPTGKVVDILPSLGASGAVYAMVVMSALAYPDAQVFLLFPPIPISITWGVGGMVAMDILGIIRGWRMFDHYAHLGGAAFGALYYKYGPDLWNELRWENAQAQKRAAR